MVINKIWLTGQKPHKTTAFFLEFIKKEEEIFRFSINL